MPRERISLHDGREAGESTRMGKEKPARRYCSMDSRGRSLDTDKPPWPSSRAAPASAWQRRQAQALVRAGACLVKARSRGPRFGSSSIVPGSKTRENTTGRVLACDEDGSRIETFRLIRLECPQEDMATGAGLEAARVLIALPFLTQNVCLLVSERPSSPLDTPKASGGYFFYRRAFGAR